MGIRKKISLSFLFLVIMLAFSGAVSIVELMKISRYSSDLLENGSANMLISKRLLDAAQRENTAMLQMIVLDDDFYKKQFDDARKDFTDTFSEAAGMTGDLEALESVRNAWTEYNQLVYSFFDTDLVTDIEWFLNMYETTYHKLTSAIKDRMVDSQNELAREALQLRTNAYRAITPGIITLSVAILIVLVFAYLLDLYYTRPLLGIGKGLKGFIDHRLPFSVKMEGKDEIRELRDSVEEIITICKNKPASGNEQ